MLGRLGGRGVSGLGFRVWGFGGWNLARPPHFVRQALRDAKWPSEPEPLPQLLWHPKGPKPQTGPWGVGFRVEGLGSRV